MSLCKHDLVITAICECAFFSFSFNLNIVGHLAACLCADINRSLASEVLGLLLQQRIVGFGEELQDSNCEGGFFCVFSCRVDMQRLRKKPIIWQKFQTR